MDHTSAAPLAPQAALQPVAPPGDALAAPFPLAPPQLLTLVAMPTPGSALPAVGQTGTFQVSAALGGGTVSITGLVANTPFVGVLSNPATPTSPLPQAAPSQAPAMSGSRAAEAPPEAAKAKRARACTSSATADSADARAAQGEEDAEDERVALPDTVSSLLSRLTLGGDRAWLGASTQLTPGGRSAATWMELDAHKRSVVQAAVRADEERFRAEQALRDAQIAADAARRRRREAMQAAEGTLLRVRRPARSVLVPSALPLQPCVQTRLPCCKNACAAALSRRARRTWQACCAEQRRASSAPSRHAWLRRVRPCGLARPAAGKPLVVTLDAHRRGVRLWPRRRHSTHLSRTTAPPFCGASARRAWSARWRAAAAAARAGRAARRGGGSAAARCGMRRPAHDSHRHLRHERLATGLARARPLPAWRGVPGGEPGASQLCVARARRLAKRQCSPPRPLSPQCLRYGRRGHASHDTCVGSWRLGRHCGAAHLRGVVSAARHGRRRARCASRVLLETPRGMRVQPQSRPHGWCVTCVQVVDAGGRLQVSWSRIAICWSPC